ncbi:hypothetical protein WJ542_03350 [Paraburkholderia sp. B3]|uniref:hypothetical protein n=1 Tax=Paraburkholderia sp. B3 TaxID=3134791 RepID=UPI003981BCD5
MARRNFLKTSVSCAQFDAIRKRADAEGLTVSAFMRAVLDRAVEGLSVVDAIRDIVATPPATATPDAWRAIQETLQLVRLMASHGHPQAAARITASCNQRRQEAL